MKIMSVTDVVSNLIGYTEPYGDSEVDEIRLENQNEAIQLCRDIIETLQTNAKYYDRPEASINKIGSKAMGYLYELKKELDEFIKENIE